MHPSKQWLTWKQLSNRDVFLNQLEQLVKQNRQATLTPIYHIGVPHATYGRNDLRYRAFSPIWNEAISILKQESVGLHSHSHLPITQQLGALQNAIGTPITFHRSHYLQHNRNQLNLELYHTSISHDFTTGDVRSLSNLEAEHQGAVQYVPTVLFDNIFFIEPAHLILERFRKLIETIAEQHRPVAIAFHPENQLLMPALQDHYHKVLQIIRQAGIPFYHSS